MGTKNLNAEQTDFLAEICNVGAGNAASALSDLVHRRCFVDVPSAAFRDRDQLSTAFGLERTIVVAVEARIVGELPALMLFVTKKVAANKMLRLMTGKEAGRQSGRELAFTARFALTEVGDAVTRAFSGGVYGLLKASTRFPVPTITVNAWAPMVDKLFAQNENPDESHLVVSTRFYETDGAFEGWFLYVLDQQGVENLLARVDDACFNLTHGAMGHASPHPNMSTHKPT